MKQYTTKTVRIPGHPEIAEIIITPARLKLINRTAAPDAKIIRLVQRLAEPPEFVVLFDSHQNH